MKRNYKLLLISMFIFTTLGLVGLVQRHHVLADVIKNWTVNGQFSLFNAGVGGPDVGITQGLKGGNATMELTTSDTSGQQATRLLLRGKTNTPNFELYSGSRGSEVLRFMVNGSSGNVGIGVDSPTSRLEVDGGITAKNSGALSSSNNNLAGMNFGWLGDQAQVRIGGDGPGARNGLAIREVGNTTLLKIDETSGILKLTSDYPVICIGKC